MFRQRHGAGVLNTLINKLPVELHVPGYRFCGPGTRLQHRLAQGQVGINPLDDACREHDIAYSKSSNLEDRHRADHVLQEKAWQRVKSNNATFGERATAWAVTTAMKAKRKFGMGIKKKTMKAKRKIGKGIKRNKKAKSCCVPFSRGIIKGVAQMTKKHISQGGSLISMIKPALLAAKHYVKRAGGKKKIKVPRVIPIPKQGGFLPFLIPLFAGLSAVGALAGGASGVAKAVMDAKRGAQELQEAQRHNNTMEAIALGKKGSALYLRPHKNKGSALYLKPSKN